jgi:hypothetical protein
MAACARSGSPCIRPARRAWAVGAVALSGQSKTLILRWNGAAWK